MVKVYRVHSSRFLRAARARLGAVLVLAAAVVAFGAVGEASADDCVALGGSEIGGECRIAGAVPAKTGTFTLDKTLHFTPGGSLKVGAAGITINITTGNLVMETNTLIDGNNQPNGAAITVTLANGNIDLQTGSIIRSNGTVGGFIQLTTASTGIANVDGLVESVGSQSGQSPNQGPGGGPITIKAGCELEIGDTGVVSSRGFDAGADLVHLEGCVVRVFGLVESTAPGHGIPNNPANSCSDAPTLSPRRNPITRPGKPQNSTGCVEIWSGTTVLIDSTGTHRGEVNADIGFIGGSNGRGWIDILANGNIEIKDGTGNDRTLPASVGCVVQTTFAVHANGGLCQTTDDGGLALIQSYLGDVIASGDAIQTDGSDATRGLPGGIGGEIRVEAQSDVTFTSANVFARGDFVVPGFGQGGKIGPLVPTVPPPGAAPLRAFNGTLSWTSGIGDARPTGAAVPVAQRGEINLQSCAAPVLGALFPTNGAPVLPYPNVLPNACGGAPTMPAYVVGFPSALCDTLCRTPGGGRKSGQKFHDLLANGVKDLGDPGLPNWEMRVFQGGVFIVSQVTDANGNYEFNLLPGTYVVCEVLQAGWTQTFPVAVGGNVVSCAGLGAGLAPLGYEFTITTGSVETDNDFGNAQAAPLCPKFPTLSATTTITLDPNNPNQIQTAIANASTDDVILLMPQNGGKSENIVIDKRIQLIGCSVTLTAANPGAAVVQITSGANGGLTKDVHATGSTVAGYKLEGSGHNVQNVRAFGNAIGFHVLGSSNILKGTLGTTNNGIGFKVEGNSNTLDTNNGVSNNSLEGVLIVGGSGNIVKKLTVSGNGGNGIKVDTTATNTTLSENKAFSNGANGFLVLGTNTPMSKNVAGDIGTGNTGDGIRVAGNGGAMSENTSRANGLVGIRVTGTGHNLSKNKSGGSPSQNNSSCQYVVGASNTNGGQNTTSNNAAFSFTAAGANAPTGCVPAPPLP